MAHQAVRRTQIPLKFAAGGTILIGVEDKSGVRGVKDPLAMEERVASLISDSISPRLLPDLELLTYRDAQVLAVNVYPSAVRPHFLNRSGPEVGTYVGVGSTNRRADADLVAEMQRFARGEVYDERPMPDLDSEAIDFRVASESFAHVRKLKRPDLETLRLLTNHQGHQVPTVGGVLLFGGDRLGYFPDAWIQAGRFRGTDKGSILDHTELKMPLVQAIGEAVAFVEKRQSAPLSLRIDLGSPSSLNARSKTLNAYASRVVESASQLIR